jgi:hypothetical protein
LSDRQNMGREMSEQGWLYHYIQENLVNGGGSWIQGDSTKCLDFRIQQRDRQDKGAQGSTLVV